MALKFDIPHGEVERRKDVVRRVWDYKEVDHIPVCFDLKYNPGGITVREELTDKEKQLELRLYNIEKSINEIPDDYIPSCFLNIGCVGVDVAYGAEVFWEDEARNPYIKKEVINKTEDIFKLQKPDVRKDGMFPMFLDLMKYVIKETEGYIPVSCLDNNGITGVACDLLGADRFYMMLLDDEAAMKHLLDMISDTIIEFTDVCIEIAGGINNVTSTDWFYFWTPEGRKGHVSCDASANYGPQMFKKYDIPFNNKIFEKYGAGLLHNCGPNPCGLEYPEHSQNLAGVNLAYKYSKDDFARMKKAYSGKNIIYIIFDNESPEEALSGWKTAMEILSPDVISIPIVFIAEETDDIARLYERYLKVGKEYARRVWR